MKPILLLLLTAVLACADEEKSANPQLFKHRITGLFSHEREAVLREAVAEIPGVELVSIDFDHAEGTFRYDPAVAFKGTKPEEIEKSLHNKVGSATHYTLGIQPLIATPPDQLTRVEIPIAGLDCQACCLAAYESIFKVEGVAQATASFQEGKLTALIDPTKTTRDDLIAALKKRQVKVPGPEQMAKP
jgi:copper chaperone CopZ